MSSGGLRFIVSFEDLCRVGTESDSGETSHTQSLAGHGHPSTGDHSRPCVTLAFEGECFCSAPVTESVLVLLLSPATAIFVPRWCSDGTVSYGSDHIRLFFNNRPFCLSYGSRIVTKTLNQDGILSFFFNSFFLFLFLILI